MMPKGFRPLLASPVDLSQLKFPVLVSPKLDGIRCVIGPNNVPYSRQLKAIPNLWVQERFASLSTDITLFDGELIVGAAYGQEVFSRTTSGVMSRDGKPDFTFYVFDYAELGVRYSKRQRAISALNALCPNWIQVLSQSRIETYAELEDVYKRTFLLGYEGIMIRDPDGVYKYGRSTVKEGILLKWKAYEDEEATVVGFVEKLHNGNPDERSELGYAKRSKRREGLKPAGTLGALVCESESYTDTFEIGTGFNDAVRADIWNHRRKYRGKLARFKHQPYGAKDKPRCPVFIGFRDRRDT